MSADASTVRRDRLALALTAWVMPPLLALLLAFAVGFVLGVVDWPSYAALAEHLVPGEDLAGHDRDLAHPGDGRGIVKAVMVELCAIAATILVALLAAAVARRRGLTPTRARHWLGLRPVSVYVAVWAAMAGIALRTVEVFVLSVQISGWRIVEGARAFDMAVEVLPTFGNHAEPIARSMTSVFGTVWEEFYFRGLAWESLVGLIGPLGAFLATTTLWVVAHTDMELFWLQGPSLLANGLLRLRTGSMLPALCLHLTYNACAQLPIPVMLTAAGIPGSVFLVVIVGALGASWAWWSWRGRRGATGADPSSNA